MLPIPLYALNNEIEDKFNGSSHGDHFTTDSVDQYLFRYHKKEKQFLSKFFQHNFGRNPIFLEHLNMGIISLAKKDIYTLETEHSQIYDQLHSSRSYSVLPSVDNLITKRIHETNQFEYALPADIVNASSLWQEGIDGTGTKIAIIDSGIDSTHPDFNDIKIQKSFVSEVYGYAVEEGFEDYHGHGTHVAGIAAANSQFYPGVAFNAELVNLKVADEFGSATNAGLIAAINEAINENVDVISISLGFAFSTPWSSDDPLTDAVNTAVDNGINVVVAAGNEGTDPVPYTTINTPASASKVITVGATDGNKEVLSFSSQGPSLDFRVDPDVVAPGYQIVGPLASQSVIDLAYNALVGVSLSDYVILSGTSMATPIVSGAIALLRQKYPDASPHAIRAALQESAYDLGEEETIYSQGCGLINIEAASELLAMKKETSGYDIISSSPKAGGEEIDFFQPIAFPGDHTEITLSFVTGIGGTVTWEVSDSIKKFINFDFSSNNLESSSYFEKTLIVDIPLDEALGEYQGYLRYNFRGEAYDIPIQFKIQAPTQKIYWDTYHTGIDDSYLLNYRVFNELLQDFHYDVSSYNSKISWTELSQNNILLLTDLEFPLTQREIQYIEDFHKNNGSIILVTSFFPYFNPDPYERISDVLNLPINFSIRKELVGYTDDGRERSPFPIMLPKENFSYDPNNLFLNGVSKIPTLGGSLFYGDLLSPDFSAYITEKGILDINWLAMAGLEPVNKGKVLILGSEEWLYPSYMSTPSGQKFFSNVMNWFDLNQTISNVRYDNTSHSLELAIYSPSIQDYNVTISFNNGTRIEDFIIHYNDTLGFNYKKYTLNSGIQDELQIEIIDPFISSSNAIEISVICIASSILPSINEIRVTPSASSFLEIPSWADQEVILIDRGLSVYVNHSPSSSILVQLVVSSHHERTLDVLIPPITLMQTYIAEETDTDIFGREKFIYWSLPDYFPCGYYSFEINLWWNNSGVHPKVLRTVRDFFFVPEKEPSLFEPQCSIGGISLQEYRSYTSLEDFPSWEPGQIINITLEIEDYVPWVFEVHIQLLHYYLFAADRTVLDHYIVPPSPSDSTIHKTNLTIPEEPIPLPDEEYDVEINGEIFVLLFFIRDNQGNYVMEPIFFIIEKQFEFDITPLLIGGSVFLGILVFAIFTIRRSNRDRFDPYSISQYRERLSETRVDSVPSIMKFCVYCGSKVPPESKFCGTCGKQLAFKE